MILYEMQGFHAPVLLLPFNVEIQKSNLQLFPMLLLNFFSQNSSKSMKNSLDMVEKWSLRVVEKF